MRIFKKRALRKELDELWEDVWKTRNLLHQLLHILGYKREMEMAHYGSGKNHAHAITETIVLIKKKAGKK